MNQNSSTLRVAGCSGSAGNPSNGTSCFMLNDKVLVDSGTSLLSLSVDEISNIDHVIAEVSMSNAYEELAIITGLLTPRMVESQIQELSKRVTVWLGFFKEWQRPKLEEEMQHMRSDCAIRIMEGDWVFEF